MVSIVRGREQTIIPATTSCVGGNSMVSVFIEIVVSAIFVESSFISSVVSGFISDMAPTITGLKVMLSLGIVSTILGIVKPNIVVWGTCFGEGDCSWVVWATG